MTKVKEQSTRHYNKDVSEEGGDFLKIPRKAVLMLFDIL
jgi:hypothetical protein